MNNECLISPTYFLARQIAVNNNMNKISKADSGNRSNTSLSAQIYLDLNADCIRCAKHIAVNAM